MPPQLPKCAPIISVQMQLIFYPQDAHYANIPLHTYPHCNTPHAHAHPRARSFAHHPNHRHPMVTINAVSPSVVHADAQAIATGAAHSMMLKQDGSVWTTGWNERGQLGDGTRINRLTFVKVMPSGQCSTMDESYTNSPYDCPCTHRYNTYTLTITKLSRHSICMYLHSYADPNLHHPNPKLHLHSYPNPNLHPNLHASYSHMCTVTSAPHLSLFHFHIHTHTHTHIRTRTYAYTRTKSHTHTHAPFKPIRTILCAPSHGHH